MACKCARYDAAAHRILPHAGMLAFFSGDEKSLNIIRSLMPHRYVVMPCVEIVIGCKDPASIDVYLIYPGETKLIQKTLSVRGVEGLRRTYQGKRGWRSIPAVAGSVRLRFEGRVILDPLRRYGITA